MSRQEQGKDRRILNTERKLCEALLLLLQKESFDKITVQTLCSKAKIRRATFYNHFADKYDLLKFMINQLRLEMQEQTDLADKSGEAYIAGLFPKAMEFFREHEVLIQSVAKSTALPIVLEILTDSIYQNMLLHLDDGYRCDEIRKETMASFYAGGIVHTLLNWSTGAFADSNDGQLNHEIRKLIHI